MRCTRRAFPLVSLLALVLLVGPVADPARAEARAQEAVAVGTGGAVATEHPLASQAAISILSQGGNAVDAAVAAAAVQGVTRPFSGGLGGGGFLVLYRAATDDVVTIDHRDRAPGSFGPDAFIDPRTGGLLSPALRNTSGPAVAVPGTPMAWEQALAEHGTMSLGQVLAPAIAVADDGFVIDENYHAELSRHATRFSAFWSTAETYLAPDGGVPPVGSVAANPDLGDTYRAFAAHGSGIFYTGAIAQVIADTVNDPPLADGADRYVKPGDMTMADLAGYSTVTRQPTAVRYRSYDVYGMGPPSSGGVTVGQGLRLLAGFDVAGMSAADALHHYLEASRIAFADRTYLGDPDLSDIPARGLLSTSYANERRALLGDEAATSRVAPGDPWPHEPALSATATAEPMVEPSPEDDSTIHLTVADGDGNVVAYTNTIVTIGGNAMVVPGHGYLLNNSLAGRIPGSDPDGPNEPRPYMRPLSSMAPTVVTERGRAVLGVGSPGGNTIITTVFGVLVDHLDRGVPLPDAIAAPRLSQRNLSSLSTEVEPAFRGTPEEAALQARGHSFRTTTIEQGIGAVNAFARLPDGRFQAASEAVRRGGGSAMVVAPTPDGVRRIGDRNRVGTAVAVSRETYPAGAPSVVIARADDYADALTGGPLAAALDAPMLLSAQHALPSAVASEVTRLGAQHAVLLGGSAALGPGVEAGLAAAGVTSIERAAGDNRYGTARAVAERLPDGDEVFLTEGANADPGRGWPDAVAVSGLAASSGVPILITSRDALPDETIAALDERAADAVTIIGGTAAVSEDVETVLVDRGHQVERLAGTNRYETSAAVAQRAVAEGADPARPWLLTGLMFPDALAAGPAAAADGGVAVLVDGRGLDRSPATRDWLAGVPDGAVFTLVGGTSAISGQVEQDLAVIGAAPAR